MDVAEHKEDEHEEMVEHRPSDSIPKSPGFTLQIPQKPKRFRFSLLGG
jgi:hypothetical protein